MKTASTVILYAGVWLFLSGIAWFAAEVFTKGIARRHALIIGAAVLLVLMLIDYVRWRRARDKAFQDAMDSVKGF